MTGRSLLWAVIALAAVVTLVTSACGTGGGTTAGPGPTAPASDLDTRLRPIITEAMRDMSVPGVVVLVRTPAGQYLEAFGTRRVGTDEPVEVGDHFRIGSNTKTMTGTVVLQLVQEGRIGLSDPVAKYQPRVPNGADITIAQMLDMRSGLYNYSELESFNRAMDEDPGKVWQPQELVALALAQPPYFAPGQGFHYSNTNTVLLGMIIEQITGQKLENVFQERIFTPLGLRNTVFPPLTSNSILDPHPQGYLFGTNVATLADPALPPDQQAAAREGTLVPNDVTGINPSWAWAAGAAISSAEDLATYVKPLVTGGLLDAATQKQRIDSLPPPTPNGISASYGLALARFGPMIGHDGSLPGYQSFMGYDPDGDKTLIVLTNLQAAPNGAQPANEIAKRIIVQAQL
ncbi:serine hydrolase domain-containing protein [Pseudonocardia alaniniphila]|uniref:Beta-lactamase family protein n=1 Tax=Pseudonocardia alaniniphila TaxID=75291 RepID=A0ABS9TCF9_9PSEU|nr:beta-lactamase family protein [Pseudonocardia alaniniphila]MCH6166231.1 beta-lactamase family protein [Pseudonocardia alaniniphila]